MRRATAGSPRSGRSRRGTRAWRPQLAQVEMGWFLLQLTRRSRATDDNLRRCPGERRDRPRRAMTRSRGSSGPNLMPGNRVNIRWRADEAQSSHPLEHAVTNVGSCKVVSNAGSSAVDDQALVQAHGVALVGFDGQRDPGVVADVAYLAAPAGWGRSCRPCTSPTMGPGWGPLANSLTGAAARQHADGPAGRSPSVTVWRRTHRGRCARSGTGNRSPCHGCRPRRSTGATRR